MSITRESTGCWDIMDKMEVFMPPTKSETQYKHWVKTAPVDDVRRWSRLTKTLAFMDACYLNGVKMGLPEEGKA